MISTTRPKILDNIYNEDNLNIGKFGGIILKDLKRDLFVEKLIDGLKIIKDDSIDSLILEDMYLLNKEDIKLIEKNTGLKVLDGVNTLIFYLPILLKSIYKILDKDLQEEEVLVINDDEIQSKKIIELLYNEVQFITLIGENKENVEKISEDILEKTGLSVFNPKNIENILKNYSIIINFKEDMFVDLTKIKRDALVFDFSIKKELGNIKKNSIVIEELMFHTKDMNIKDNIWLNELVPSRVCEYLCNDKVLDIELLKVNQNLYRIKDFVQDKMSNRGRL